MNHHRCAAYGTARAPGLLFDRARRRLELLDGEPIASSASRGAIGQARDELVDNARTTARVSSR